MPSYLLKAAIQGTLALLPAPHRFNRLFQRFVTGHQALHSRAGWLVLAQEVGYGSPTLLSATPIAAVFRHYGESELLAQRLWIVS